MADQSHDDVSFWLKQFRDELDITKVGLAEESIVSLMESSDMPVSGNVMDQITKEADWQSQYPAEFIAASLAPADVISVTVDESGEKSCKVIVPDMQLSLAIGNRGQNARLAAKLTGWKIDIKPLSAAAE